LFPEFRAKRNKKPKKISPQAAPDPAIDELPPEVTPAASPAGPALSLSLTGTPEDDIEGVELHAYARKYQTDVDAVWKKIRAGQLVARTENGFIYVYGKHIPAHDFSGGYAAADDEGDRDLPPLPRPEASSLPAAINTAASAEVALLLDHLVMSREEHRHLLVLTQDSINRISRMSESVITMKDNLLDEKERLLHAQDEQIKNLKAEISRNDQEARRLKQSVEDLEMLARTLTER